MNNREKLNRLFSRMSLSILLNIKYKCLTVNVELSTAFTINHALQFSIEIILTMQINVYGNRNVR